MDVVHVALSPVAYEGCRAPVSASDATAALQRPDFWQQQGTIYVDHSERNVKRETKNKRKGAIEIIRMGRYGYILVR